MTRFMLGVLICLSFAFPASAQSFSLADREQVEKVEAYLSGIETLEADFQQIAPDGSLAHGKFYLSRPGRMRWQYAPPTPILMVANGSHLIFHDYELDQTSYIPLESTLAGFLARKDVRFGKDVVIKSLNKGAGVLRLTVYQQERPKDGELTLEFSTGPLQLRNMKILDAVGQETTVSLQNARFNIPLGKELFVFESSKTKPKIGKPREQGNIMR